MSDDHRRQAAPVWLTLLTIYLACLVIDPGQLGFDTARRLQTTHWLWTAADSLLAEDKALPYAINIAVGGNGQAHYGYGLGHSLLMLPGDMIGTWLGHLATHGGGQPELIARLRRVVVAYLTFPLIETLTAWAMLQVFIALTRDARIATTAVLLSFVATRWFDISQSYQETGVQLCCLLTGLGCLLRWRDTGRDRNVWVAGAAFALLTITRIVSLLDITLVCAGFGLVLLTDPGPRSWMRWGLAAAKLGVCITAGVVIDRVYQFVRFGDWTSTYLGLYSKRVAEVRAHSPVPLEGAFNDPAFPWTLPIQDGALSAFVSPRWGLLWFDAMVPLLCYLLLRFGRHLPRAERIFAGMGAVYLAAVVLFYGRYYEPAGWTSWGDRYAEVPIVFLSILGVLILVQTWQLHRAIDRAIVLLLAGVAIATQLVSGVFYAGLEAQQFLQGCGSKWILLQRLRNIATFWHGRAPNSDCVLPAQQWLWDPYVFPGVLARIAVKGATGQTLLWTAWAGAALAVLALAAWTLSTPGQTAGSRQARGTRHVGDAADQC
jgi:hypothetical protein